MLTGDSCQHPAPAPEEARRRDAERYGQAAQAPAFPHACRQSWQRTALWLAEERPQTGTKETEQSL